MKFVKLKAYWHDGEYVINTDKIILILRDGDKVNVKFIDRSELVFKDDENLLEKTVLGG